MTTAAVLLAAGAGSRFEGPVHKLLVPFRGRPLLGWAAEAAHGAGCDETFVVVGDEPLEDVLPAGVVVLHNRDSSAGQASSLQVAVASAHDHDHDAVVVGLADQPLVGADAWRAVGRSRSPIAVATYDGRRRNPVRLHRSVWSLLPRTGDRGAKVLIEAREDLVEEIPCRGSAVDIDTPEDLARWS